MNSKPTNFRVGSFADIDIKSIDNKKEDRLLVPNDYLNNRTKEKMRNDSTGAFIQSKTPIFNENSLSP